MIVVADTGPLHYLILLDHAELLHRFYDEVVPSLESRSGLANAPDRRIHMSS